MYKKYSNICTLFSIAKKNILKNMLGMFGLTNRCPGDGCGKKSDKKEEKNMLTNKKYI